MKKLSKELVALLEKEVSEAGGVYVIYPIDTPEGIADGMDVDVFISKEAGSDPASLQRLGEYIQLAFKHYSQDK